MIVLFVVFGETSILFSTVAAPIYTSTNSVQEFPFFPLWNNLYVLAQCLAHSIYWTNNWIIFITYKKVSFLKPTFDSHMIPGLLTDTNSAVSTMSCHLLVTLIKHLHWMYGQLSVYVDSTSLGSISMDSTNCRLRLFRKKIQKVLKVKIWICYWVSNYLHNTDIVFISICLV